MALAKGTLIRTVEDKTVAIENMTGYCVHGISEPTRVLSVEEINSPFTLALAIDGDRNNILTMSYGSMTTFNIETSKVCYHRIIDFYDLSAHEISQSYFYEPYDLCGRPMRLHSFSRISHYGRGVERGTVFYRMNFESKDGRFVIAQNNLVMYEPQFR